MHLSGYFEEKQLDRHIAYPKGTSNITDSPSWISQGGTAEDVAHAFFDGFKTITTNTRSSVLNVAAGESQSRGNDVVHYRNGENLGQKIYDILKPSGLSYRILYDFLNNTEKFEVWAGIDRTEGNVENNNPVIFSTKYGNIKNPNILIDDSAYKNACIVSNEQLTDGTSTYTSRVVFGMAEEDTEAHFLFVRSGLNRNEYEDSDFLNALDNEGFNNLQNHPRTINLEFDAMTGSYVYMSDFDLGDLCNIEIPEMKLSVQSRLIGCYEVMKSGQWSMAMEFGTPIIIR